MTFVEGDCWYNPRMKAKCAYSGAVVVAAVIAVCAGAASADPIEECARIFEAETRDGVIHGAAIAALMR